MTFVLPGIIALTVVGGAIGGGSAWLNERLTGIVKEYLVAPIPRLSILLGNAMSITTKVLVQSIIIMLVGVLMGAKLSTNPLGWAGGFLLIAGYGIGFSGIALAVASKTDSSEGYHMMIFMLQLPLLSGATRFTRWQPCRRGCAWGPCSIQPPISSPAYAILRWRQSLVRPVLTP